ncbi:MAG: hypothetical protein F6J97_20630, partial [Leptolyngbya sp. SIO4C1]|nr:hypothetical protein [Leptolyngbya sp. SIO4C1]
MFFPYLAGTLALHDDRVVIVQAGRTVCFQLQGQSQEGLYQLLSLLDGSRSVGELQQSEYATALSGLIERLAAQHLLEEMPQAEADLLSALAQLADSQLASIAIPSSANPAVLYGLAIEHYHLLSRSGYFLSPILGWQGLGQVRYAVSELYQRSTAQADAVLIALNAIDISRTNLEQALPLPETAALVNGLSFWAKAEPVFFLCAWYVLIAQICKSFKTYLAAGRQLTLASRFLDPLNTLAQIELAEHQQGLISRAFEQLSVESTERSHFEQQIYLLSELYAQFQMAIQRHYDAAHTLLRSHRWPRFCDRVLLKR